MSLLTGAASAFQAAAGVAPDKISLFVRTLLIILTLVWAAWVVGGEVNHFRHHGIEVHDALFKVFRVLFIIVIVIALIFIR